MQAAAPRKKATGMAAFVPMDLMQARTLCLEATKTGTNEELILDVACVNSPKIIVLSGDQKAMEKASQLASEGLCGEKMRVIPLDVSAPFHSQYMSSSQATLQKLLNTMKMKLGTAPVISGYSTKLVRLPEHFIENFVPLTSASVNFIGCVEQAKNILETQSTPILDPIWIEIGPKPTLTSFVSQCIPNANTHFIGSAKDLKEFLSKKELYSKLFPSE